MGNINLLNLDDIIKRYDIKYFVETGTSEGYSLDIAMKSKFVKFFSCEFNSDTYQRLIKKYKDEENLDIYNLNSFSFLKKISEEISDGNCLFWLDAHFPYGLDPINITNKDKTDIIFPLKNELSFLFDKRINYNDFILIDDLRIYDRSENNIDHKTLKEINMEHLENLGDIDDILNKFSNYKKIIKLNSHEGYILIF